MIESKLEDLRARLLDLSRRNRLLHHKGRGRSSLELVDERPDVLWRLFVEEERSLQFLAAEDASREAAEAVKAAAQREAKAEAEAVEAERLATPVAPELGPPPAPLFGGVASAVPPPGAGTLPPPPPPALPDSSVPPSTAGPTARVAPGAPQAPATPPAPEVAARHADRFLQTALPAEALEARLLHLEREAESALEEQGCNVLHLTLGAVEWRDAEGGPVCKAPLVFVPVSLARKRVGARHTLEPFDDDVIANPCLAELLRQRFRVELPPLEDGEGFELGAWFERVRAAVEPLAGWRVLPEAHVGLFSFAKLLLWRDLDPRAWPADRPLVAHPLVRALSGVADAGFSPGPAFPEPYALEALAPSEGQFLVVDADSSQHAAVLAVKAGTNAVIDGPPGTGKSQTITNVIAECLAAGRTVLFVAEKAAALDVVKRRLEAVGLGHHVLELHSRKASKRAVLEGLRRALETGGAAGAGTPAGGGAAAPGDDPAEHARARERLDAFRKAMHAPATALWCSPFDGIARVCALERAPEAAFEVGTVETWRKDEVETALERVAALDRALARVGDPATHPWRGSRLDASGVEVRQRLLARHRDLRDALAAQVAAGAAVAEALGVSAPATPADAERLARDATTLATRVVLDAAAVSDGRWDGVAARLPAWLDALAALETARAGARAAFRPEAEAEAWGDVLDRRRRHGGSIWRFLRPSWRRDSKRLRAAYVPGTRPSRAAELEALAALVEVARRRSEVEAGAKELAAPFGALATGSGATSAILRAHADSTLGARAIVLRGGATPEAARRAAEEPGRAALLTRARALQAAEGAARSAQHAWLEAVASDETAWFGGPVASIPFAALEARQRGLEEALERLPDWVDARAAEAGCDTPRLAPFLRWVRGPDAGPARGRLAEAFERQFWRVWVDKVLETVPALAAFRGDDHRALLERFRALDRAWLEGNRRRLLERLAARRPAADAGLLGGTKLGLLKAEMRRKRGHMPLRRLFQQAGDVVQAITPCFMMSPISVAQYLAPGALPFDVVIFDEASQVEPADAYGAIARGKQLLLVGDERQLPPTTFFQRLEAGEARADADEGAAAGDLESILGLAIARLPDRCRGSLRWHYRSRDESLIAFSNRTFYEDGLVTFPGPRSTRGDLGISFRPVDPGGYRRGAGQFDPVEAQAVAEAVLAHAREAVRAAPGRALSLGVGAFSVAQQRAIEDAVEALRRADPEGPAEAFFDPAADEPFFVKNLETIQGDERDVILLSVGYGRDASGRLAMNFGPVNRAEGWRRLNVLVTRARRRCVLFSTLRASDLAVTEASPRGVRALRDFLDYAERGGFPDGPASSPRDAASAVEADVAAALVGRGYGIHPRVGRGRTWVDLAVVHPDAPGRYVLGVEVDGAQWNGAATVRDRERLRPAVLEGMGWALERVHAIDWVRRRASVLDRLVARIEALRKAAPAGSPASAPSEAAPAPGPAPAAPPLRPGIASPPPAAPPRAGAGVVGEGAPTTVPSGFVAYVRPRARRLGTSDQLSHAAPSRTAQVLTEIVGAEGPIHVEEALRALLDRWEARATARPKEAFERALSAATSSGDVVRRGDFLWPKGMTQPAVRWRGDDACPVADAERIAPEELEEAIRITLRSEFGATEEGLVTATCRRLGFRRMGAGPRTAVTSALTSLLARGEVIKDREGFLVPRR